MTLKLSNRLNSVASFVDKGDRIIDVGTDHAYLPAYLIQAGICTSIVATDILEGPLSRAVATARRCGLDDKIKFVLTDGLSGIGGSEYDTVIIAGMGGENIVKILSGFNEDKKLILQPMTKQKELCEFLFSAGYYIAGEKLAEDSGKIYRIILARKGQREIPSEPYLYVGHLLFQERDPLLCAYLNRYIKKLETAISTIKSGNSGNNKLQELENLLNGFINMKGRLTDNAGTGNI